MHVLGCNIKIRCLALAIALMVYATAVLVFRRSTYGRGTGPILLDDVHCTGTETSLQQCAANDIGNHNCDHTEDAGVRCT